MERKKAKGKWWALIRISYFPNNSPRFTVKWVYYKNPKAHRIENPEQEEERWIFWHWANPETKSNPSIFLLLPPRETVSGVKDFYMGLIHILIDIHALICFVLFFIFFVFPKMNSEKYILFLIKLNKKRASFWLGKVEKNDWSHPTPHWFPQTLSTTHYNSAQSALYQWKKKVQRVKRHKSFLYLSY